MINTRSVLNPSLESSFRHIHFQETVAVGDKIKVLRSRITVLEKHFEKPAGDVAETKRREELLKYVIGPRLNWMLRAL